AVRRWGPDVLHSHRYKENILSYVVSRALKKTVSLVATQHGMPELYRRKPAFWHRLKSYANFRLLAAKFDTLIAVSADIKDSLILDHGFQEKYVEAIRNGVVVPRVRDWLRV